MSFPQTSADLAVTKGQDYWRLFTELGSSGDIYESPQSGRAFVIGPDSDIARVKIVYFDANESSQANEVIVSVDKPFIGRLDALNSQTYPSGERARLLISSADILVPSVFFAANAFTPPTAAAAANIDIVPANIDFIQYLGEVPSVIPPRSDKVFQFGQIPDIASDQQWLLVPFYGRRFADVCVKTLGTENPSVTPAIDVFVFGINFSWIIADAGLANDSGHQQEMLGSFRLNVPTFGAGVSDSITITNRAFDYLAIQIQKAGSSADYPIESSVVTRIVTSDKI